VADTNSTGLCGGDMVNCISMVDVVTSVVYNSRCRYCIPSLDSCSYLRSKQAQWCTFAGWYQTTHVQGCRISALIYSPYTRASVYRDIKGISRNLALRLRQGSLENVYEGRRAWRCLIGDLQLAPRTVMPELTFETARSER
jgi:hypothetical protein